MEFQINRLPLKMKDIPEQLFNSPFLSDITFIVDGQNIYAHSLELIKRSVVFQQQLQSTYGEKKIIPIIGYTYDTFYQFVRYIYTDECNTKIANRFELLKLAKMYKVIRLINVLLNYNYDYLEKLNFCVMEQHEIALHDTKIKLASELNEFIKSDAFLSIHPDTAEEILKIDQIKNDVNEIEILDALVRWINYYCTQNQVQFAEAREKYKHLIHLIRFPTMSVEELRDVKIKYPDLLPESDFYNIAGQKIYGTNDKTGIWNCTPRKEFIWPYEWKTHPNKFIMKTKFTVSSEMILAGFVFGSSSDVVKRILITISCQQQSGLDEITEINMNEVDVLGSSIAISLGDSIRIQPNYTYSIDFLFTNHVNFITEETKYWSRTQQTELIINAPLNSVQVLEAHETMFEIFFL